VEGPVKGDIVVVPFPFSDLSLAKRRPALVLALLDGDDVILVQITSRAVSDRYAIPVGDADFGQGSLNHPSHVRPNRIFTADRSLILYRVGTLKPERTQDVIAGVVKILQA